MGIRYWPVRRPALAEITGEGRAWTVSMNLGAVDALKVDRGDPEVGVSELSLNDHQRYAFVGHLDRVRMAQLVRGEASAYAGRRRCSS